MVLRVDVTRLLEDLRSKVATRAAERLREASGDAVTQALVGALDAHNTAIIEAAAESLIVRDEPSTANRMFMRSRRSMRTQPITFGT